MRYDAGMGKGFYAEDSGDTEGTEKKNKSRLLAALPLVLPSRLRVNRASGMTILWEGTERSGGWGDQARILRCAPFGYAQGKQDDNWGYAELCAGEGLPAAAA